MVSVLREIFAKGKHPSHDDKESAAQALASIIEQAQAIGYEIASKNKERALAWGGRFADALSSAWNIVTNFVSRITDWITGKESDGEEISQDDITEQVDTLANRVADFEVHAAIEQEVLDTLQEQGVTMKVCIAQPGACKLCLANVAVGAIPINQPFPSGDQTAPYHGGCRCNVASADEGE